MMVPASVADLLRDLKSRTGAVAVALITRDGRVLAADVGPDRYVETFGIMCATILGAAVAAHGEMDRARPDRILLDAGRTRTVIAGCGPRALLVVMSDGGVDGPALLEETDRMASLLGTG